MTYNVEHKIIPGMLGGLYFQFQGMLGCISGRGAQVAVVIRETWQWRFVAALYTSGTRVSHSHIVARKLPWGKFCSRVTLYLQKDKRTRACLLFTESRSHLMAKFREFRLQCRIYRVGQKHVLAHLVV